MLTQPPLTEQPDLGQISPTRRRHRYGVQHLGHPVVPHLLTTQNMRHHVTPSPPDGIPVVTVTVEEHPADWCCCGYDSTTAHTASPAMTTGFSVPGYGYCLAYQQTGY